MMIFGRTKYEFRWLSVLALLLLFLIFFLNNFFIWVFRHLGVLSLFVFLILLFLVFLVWFFLVPIVLSFWHSNFISVKKTFFLQLFDHIVHGFLIFSWFGSTRQEFESLFHLILEGLTELRCWGIGETINSGSNSTLICEVSWDSTLVLLTSSSNERGVENQSILWSLSFCLQSSEKGFFSTKNLDCRCWIFWEVCKSTSVRNELGTNNITNKSWKVRSYGVHSVFKILSELLSEINEFDASLCKFFDLKAILIGHFLSHRNFSSVNDLLSFFIIKNDIINLFFHFVSDIISLFHQ